MKIKVNRRVFWQNLSIICILIPFFEPSFFRNISTIHSVYSVLRMAASVYIVFQCVQLKVRFIKEYLVVCSFFLCQLISTIYNGGNYIGEIKADLYIIIACLYVGMLLSKGKKEVLTGLCIIMGGMLLLQAASIFLFPEGLYIEKTYNKYPYWFWNSAGHMSSLAFSYAILLKVCEFTISKKFRYLFVIHAVLYGYLFGIHFNDYGNFLGFLIIIFGSCIRLERFKGINALGVWAGVLGLNVALVGFNIQNIFSGLLDSVFKKDITLGGRIYIWKNGLNIVKDHLFLGKGESTYFGYPGWSTIRGDGKFYTAHNQLLNILLNGGLITLMAFLMIEFLVMVKIEGCQDKKLKSALTTGVLGILVTMLVDTLTPLLPVFMIFMIIFNLSPLMEQQV